MHVQNLNERQLEQARQTIGEKADNITIVDTNGNTNNNNIKHEIIDDENTIEINTENIRRSSRLKSNNPIIRYGNPVTH